MDKLNFKEKGLGFLESQTDPRDYHVPSGVSGKRTFPKSYNSLDGMNFQVKDQERVNSCVGFAVSVAIEIAYFRKTGKRLTYSPGFIYGNRPADVTDYLDEGYYARDALKGLQKYGVVVQNDFDYNRETPEIVRLVNGQKSVLYPKAKKLRINNYYDVKNPDPDVPPTCFESLNSETVKAQIMDSGFVIASTLVFENWYKVTKKNPVLEIPTPNDKLYGGHCILITGWTANNEWIIVNSWSKDFADDGVVYAPFDYPFTEAWGFDGITLDENHTPIPTPPPITNGWYKKNGKWRYSENNVDKIGWVKNENGYWFYLGTDGYMVTGWQKINEKWYYLKSKNGDMAIGWQFIDGRWYYFHPTSGEAQKGFITVGEKTYYLAEKSYKNIKEYQLIITDTNGAI